VLVLCTSCTYTRVFAKRCKTRLFRLVLSSVEFFQLFSKPIYDVVSVPCLVYFLFYWCLLITCFQLMLYLTLMLFDICYHLLIHPPRWQSCNYFLDAVINIDDANNMCQGKIDNRMGYDYHLQFASPKSWYMGTKTMHETLKKHWCMIESHDCLRSTSNWLYSCTRNVFGQ